ncbi:MAG: CoA transferase [Sphingorhabdus sp.]
MSIKVIDASRSLAGWAATRLLSGAGAQITLVADDSTDAGLHAFMLNEGKTRQPLSPASDEGRASLRALLADADILVHDWTGQEQHDWQLEQLPGHIVEVAIASFPRGHAMEHIPRDDVLVMAAGGILVEQRASGREGPALLNFPMASWGGAYLAAIGALARLRVKRATGQGGRVDTSLFQGALVPMAQIWAQAATADQGFAGIAKHQTTGILARCSDGLWLHLMPPRRYPPSVEAALEAMGEAARAEANAREAHHATSSDHGALMDIFAMRPRSDWLAELWAHDVPAQPVLQPGEAFGDYDAGQSGLIETIAHPAHGELKRGGVPFQLRPLATADNGVAASNGLAPERPLSGIRILDFGNFLAGPLATMLLSDLGADVLKIEQTQGDPMRIVGKMFAGCQRGKHGIVLDLKQPDARDDLDRLVANADIVHHNLRDAAAKTLGLGFDRLLVMKPSLICTHVTAYADGDPRSTWPGYDQLFQAMTGWEIANAGEGLPPVWMRFGIMDHLAAMASVVGTLAALLERDANGGGAIVKASLHEAALFTLVDSSMTANGDTVSTEVVDASELRICGRAQLVQCADGWVALRSAEAVDLSSLQGKPISGALTRLKELGIDAVAVDESGEGRFFRDPDNQRLGLIATYEHKRWGTLKQIGAFWSFDGTPIKATLSPPDLGEHNDLYQKQAF